MEMISMKLEKFVDSLPLMETIKPQRKDKKAAYYEIRMEEFKQKLHRDLRPTKLWGYNRQFPGPTIDSNQGEAVQVKWINSLPSKHFLPIDTSILVGMYIIRGPQEEALQLPTEEYEIPLIILDRSFNPDGSLFYPSQPDDAASNLPNPSILPAHLGDTILVNGKVWPYLEVEPRKYRFRILNASNTRTYRLSLDAGLPFYQIGSDGGLLRKMVEMSSFVIEPAVRVDLIIDFSKYQGQKVILKNDLGANADPEDETNEVMQFHVNLPLTGKDDSIIPKELSYIPTLKHNNVKTIRNLKLVGSEDEYGRPLLLLNNKKWMDPITENPRLGSTEIWSFMNVTGFTHPMHIHLIQFQVLDRQPFDLELYNKDGTILFTGPPTVPAANERGWKDTIPAPSAQFTRVIAKFAPYTGDYVWHCHILEHEDYDMMRPFTIIVSEATDND
uniref:Plastocyanin-like domain-containing protein n=1 Tax=Batrachochytrium dendrobatidis (strain JAM81 / FGSC 10211) TaxID=684364 RepID=F4PFZ6_BATDJ|eukprot:XP_006683529.1 hypothetical protein BATDEDRAFT_93287 [Batrachochytrium dendrobatidis JAM81]